MQLGKCGLKDDSEFIFNSNTLVPYPSVFVFFFYSSLLSTSPHFFLQLALNVTNSLCSDSYNISATSSLVHHSDIHVPLWIMSAVLSLSETYILFSCYTSTYLLLLFSHIIIGWGIYFNLEHDDLKNEGLFHLISVHMGRNFSDHGIFSVDFLKTILRKVIYSKNR